MTNEFNSNDRTEMASLMTDLAKLMQEAASSANAAEPVLAMLETKIDAVNARIDVLLNQMEENQDTPETNNTEHGH